MPTFTLRDRVVVRPDVLARTLDGEAVILNLENGVYFGLDEVGARVWALLEDRSLGEVSAAIAGEYDAPLAQIEADVLALVAQLEAKGLVEPAPRHDD